MIRRTLLPVITLLALSSPVLAQETGGLALAPGLNGGPTGLARPLPFQRMPLITARDVQNGMTAADHQAQNQNTITALRGDPGFLSGFSFGTPLAASRQAAVSSNGDGWHHHHRGSGPVIINNQGPLALTVGNGNSVQQQSANGSGPIALQQVATTPGRGTSGGGALNLVSGSGNIIQSAPSGR